ncbi:hypothetical protein [Saccharopolyspora endophytica]|uniref:Uncharacterized protein n=1 Tax=Saccharopolyspora endophytica TaxID=543886 RepID=A0ABS5DK04_9PSEU|nr:hypothetical protein [Saccharopolyspora endophytica]MBQ0926623.1 hypothetical protein [Saccharopolyspora endophytica]
MRTLPRRDVRNHLLCAEGTDPRAHRVLTSTTVAKRKQRAFDLLAV